MVIISQYNTYNASMGYCLLVQICFLISHRKKKSSEHNGGYQGNDKKEKIIDWRKKKYCTYLLLNIEGMLLAFIQFYGLNSEETQLKFTFWCKLLSNLVFKVFFKNFSLVFYNTTDLQRLKSRTRLKNDLASLCLVSW